MVRFKPSVLDEIHAAANTSHSVQFNPAHFSQLPGRISRYSVIIAWPTWDPKLENEKHEPITLRIYRAPSGRWAGCLLVGEADIGSFDGYDSPDQVEEAARETGVYPDRVEVY